MKLKAKLHENLPRVEYKQFDAETLAVIANLGSTSDESAQRRNGLSDSLNLATGNRSQFVFCLTNPCENGGTCFVTNTATTKVRFLEKEFQRENFLFREFVFVEMDILEIIVKIHIIIHQLDCEYQLVIVHQVLV